MLFRENANEGDKLVCLTVVSTMSQMINNFWANLTFILTVVSTISEMINAF